MNISTPKQTPRRSSRRSMIVSKYLFRSATRNIDFIFVFYILKWITFASLRAQVRDGIERNGMSNLKFMELFEKVYLSGTEQEKCEK